MSAEAHLSNVPLGSLTAEVLELLFPILSALENPLIHLLSHQYFLSSYYVVGTVLDCEITLVRKRDLVPDFMELTV